MLIFKISIKRHGINNNVKFRLHERSKYMKYPFIPCRISRVGTTTEYCTAKARYNETFVIII
jgi:hypothetical protein